MNQYGVMRSESGRALEDEVLSLLQQAQLLLISLPSFLLSDDSFCHLKTRSTISAPLFASYAS